MHVEVRETTIQSNGQRIRDQVADASLLPEVPAGLKEFEENVQRCRARFLGSLASLPAPFGEIARRNYIARMTRGSGRAVLGEYAPWLVASLIGLDDPADVEPIITPWLQIYSFVIFLDAVFDEPGLPEKEALLVTSAILLERGIAALALLPTSSPQLFDRVDECFVDTARAALTELASHRAKLRGYSDEDLERLGHKVSIVKLCAYYTLAARGAEGIGNLDLKALEGLFSGIQLLDDVTDWKEDWASTNYTYPLSLCCERLMVRGIARAADPRSLSENELVIGLIVTSSISESLARSRAFLSRALVRASASGAGDSAGALYLSTICSNISRVEPQLEDMKQHLERELDIRPDKEDWLRKLSRRDSAKKQIRRFTLVMPLVAQEC